MWRRSEKNSGYSVRVYCGSSDQIRAVNTQAAIRLGELFARNGSPVSMVPAGWY